MTILKAFEGKRSTAEPSTSEPATREPPVEVTIVGTIDIEVNPSGTVLSGVASSDMVSHGATTVKALLVGIAIAEATHLGANYTEIAQSMTITTEVPTTIISVLLGNDHNSSFSNQFT